MTDPLGAGWRGSNREVNPHMGTISSWNATTGTDKQETPKEGAPETFMVGIDVTGMCKLLWHSG